MSTRAAREWTVGPGSEGAAMVLAVEMSSSLATARAYRIGAMDRIDALLAGARQAWPGIDVDPARFRSYVAGRVEGALDEQALGDRRLDDLYLACACADGDERAATTFRNTFQAAIAATAARAAPAHLCDEICQLVHAKLLVGDGDRPPAIASYLGVGKLSTWVQVVAARVARSRIRSENRHGG